MTTAKVITIHEFSTGIQAQRTEDGNWVSQGFTGKYMNTTLDPIPSIVRKAISNRLFAVAEGTSRDEPALIGREITEDSETWSVIAVVSKETDDGGRSASMYRYFLSEGKNQLTPILRWLFTVKKDYVFNPFDYQEIGQPHQADRDKNSPPVDKKDHLIELAAKEAPIIISSDGQTIKPLIINSLASEKAKENGYPIAWAYQVEALEKPRSFQVIYPASAKAEQILRNSLASNPNAPVFIANEQDINTAIKTIFRKGKIEIEQLLTLEKALQNPQITEEYWQGLFSGQGAEKALKSGIYSAQMVRLLALQAIILPATLPQVLTWLEKREKNEEEKKLFIDFQKQVRKNLAINHPESDFLALKQKIIEGVRLLIPSVIKQPDLFKPTVSLLKPQNGLWGTFYHYHVKQEIERDLTTAPLIRGYQPNAVFTLLAEPLWEELFQNIKSTWERNRVSPKEKYLPLAEFFEQVSYYPASALFYHIAWGEVPKEVFDACSSDACSSDESSSRKQIYGVWAKRHFTRLEKLWKYLIENIVETESFIMFSPFILFTLLFMGSIIISTIFETNSSSNPNPNIEKNIENYQSEPKPPPPVLTQTEVNAFDNQTRESIRQIVNDDSLFTLEDQSRLSDQKFSDQDNYIDVLRNDIFNNPNLQISVITEDNRPNNVSLERWQTWKKLWINAVKDYQREQGSNVIDGIITPNAGTHQAIRKQLEDRKQKATENPPEG